jgi:hypothetical protein
LDGPHGKGGPSFRMRLMVTVPVNRAFRGIKKLLSVYETHVAVAEHDIVPLAVEGGCLLAAE